MLFVLLSPAGMVRSLDILDPSEIPAGEPAWVPEWYHPAGLLNSRTEQDQ